MIHVGRTPAESEPRLVKMGGGELGCYSAVFNQRAATAGRSLSLNLSPRSLLVITGARTSRRLPRAPTTRSQAATVSCYVRYLNHETDGDPVGIISTAPLSQVRLSGLYTGQQPPLGGPVC